VTKAQHIYEQVEALVASGKTKADAFKQLSEQLGQPVGSLRGAYYQHSKKENGGSTSRRRETTPDDAVQAAIQTLRRAIDSIDAEIVVAQRRADEATAEYQALKASAGKKKTLIEAKIATLAA